MVESLIQDTYEGWSLQCSRIFLEGYTATRNSTNAKPMANTYPIIETQLRLIRALQKGYVEALEAGDWQAANYRCLHLHKLCEGLHHLSELLNQENRIPDTVASKGNNNWVSSIHSTSPIHTLSPSSETIDQPVMPTTLPSEAARYEWGMGFQGLEPPPIDEVW
jgi:hypothetical protein